MTSIATIFQSALTKGLFFLPNASFKQSSLQPNLREEELTFPGTSFPDTPTIIAYINSNINAPFFNNCIAFSINNNKKVIYKYQLFYEDIQLSSTAPADPKVGVYVRNLDDYMTLKPSIGNLGFRGYGGIGGDGGRDYISIAKNLSNEDFFKVIDNGWFIMCWNEGRIDCSSSPFYQNLPQIGNNFKWTTDKTSNRAVFKARRITKDTFELYATDGNVLKNIWRYVRQLTLSRNGNPGGGLWSASLDSEFGFSQYTAAELKASQNLNYFYTDTNPSPILRTQDMYSGPAKLWKDEYGLIQTEKLHLENGSDGCYLSTDVVWSNCGFNTGNGNIIQPSLTSIIERLLNIKGNETDYKLGFNLCANKAVQSVDSLIDPNLYPLTNVFISNIVSSTASYCVNKGLEFCSQDDNTGKSNLFTDECQRFCEKEANCINIVKDYCTRKGSLALDSTNRSICGCSTNTEFVQKAYDQYMTERARKQIPDTGCKELKYTFSPCRISKYGNSQGTTNIVPGNCEQGAVCYSLIEVNNNGNITGMNIDAKVNQDCKTIVSKVESGTQSCTTSSDCENTEYKKCVRGYCVECDQNSDCPTENPICSDKNVCVECNNDSNCNSTNPYCVSGVCKVCNVDENCGTGKKCSNGSCVNECAADTDCGANKICSSEGKCIDSQKNTNYIIYGIIGISILVVLFVAIRLYKNR